jgi:hypothetical protein
MNTNYDLLHQIIPDFDPANVLVVDTECGPNYWMIGLRRLSDGKTLVMEHSERSPLSAEQRARLYKLMMSNLIVTYNGISYDFPMIFLAINGASNAELKQANDRIIVGKMRPWNAREVLGVEVPRDCFIRKDGSRGPGLWHVDALGPCPAPPSKTGGESFPAGLKTIAGRLHAQKMQDLPYSPDAALTNEQIDNVRAYMGNDLVNTELVFNALVEPLALRYAFSRRYGVNLMSKSDSQCGEAIIKRAVEDATNTKVQKVETPGGTTFRFNPPAYLQFTPGSELADIFKRVCETDFMVQANGKVELPEWLSSKLIGIGVSEYQIGIGGLHSTEKERALLSDDEFDHCDFDVASFYPRIIINTKLYPKALGPKFLPIYTDLTDQRVAAKISGDKTTANGVKIFVNGGGFGKLGSPFSVLNAPHLLIATTLTGQFALLMLIQQAEELGISVVSANTDGVVFRTPKAMMGPVVDDRVTEGPVKALIEKWEAATGFSMEATPYAAMYNASVNSYIAVKPNGKAKIKGALGNPWSTGDLRGQMMKNPQNTIVSDAVVALILHGTPLEDTIYASRDIRQFVTVVKVTGGATWRGDYLGKVVRFYWAHDGDEILKAKGHATTGTLGKVPNSDGCRPLMNLPDEFPSDVDHEAYIRAAEDVLLNIGYRDRPAPVKPLRLFKWSAPAWFAVAV